MSARSIVDRLKAGEVLVMDGGTGSEPQRRGINISKGATTEKRPTAPPKFASTTVPGVTYRSTTGLGVWSAPANLDAPDVVRQIHEDYLKVGAEILISNTFYTSRAMLSKIGEQDRWEEYARRGVELAVQARDALNPNATIAGGFAPPFTGDLKAEFENSSRVLAEAGVDWLLPEYMGGDTIHKSPIEDCVTAVEACGKTDLPVFLGVCNVKDDGNMLYGETLEELVSALKGHRVDGIFLMCTQPAGISAGLPKLRKAFKGPIGAYAELGYEENPKFGTSAGEQFFVVEKLGYTPERYAEFALEWKKMGAQVIGGCCATGPEHIKAVHEILKD
ncbi:MAG: homocysteine S-methyltransferase family protein [Acidobacteria bacterium]|nr:homocysteine S-methyltransferase family protein [Acidobacteriota bacterium]